MKIKSLFILSLLFLFCFVPAAFSQTPALSLEFETVDQGDFSYYNYNNPNFKGVDMIIKDKRAWAYFWEQHTCGIMPKPPLPDIEFTKEMVIVSIVGYQIIEGSCAQILEVNMNKKASILRILIDNTTVPGSLAVITNPYHIVKLRRVNARSIVFEHECQ